MARDRIVSIAEAAAIKGQSKEAIVKAIHTGRIFGHPLSGKGYMLSERNVMGLPFDKAHFVKLCREYISIPDACNIVWKTDAAVGRDLRSGRIKGFKLNGKCWAVLKSSAEQEFRDYLDNLGTTVGRRREIGGTRSPRDLRKQRLKKRPK